MTTTECREDSGIMSEEQLDSVLSTITVPTVEEGIGLANAGEFAVLFRLVNQSP